MPLPTRPQRYCDPASLVSFRVVSKCSVTDAAADVGECLVAVDADKTPINSNNDAAQFLLSSCSVATQ